MRGMMAMMATLPVSCDFIYGWNNRSFFYLLCCSWVISAVAPKRHMLHEHFKGIFLLNVEADKGEILWIAHVSCLSSWTALFWTEPPAPQPHTVFKRSRECDVDEERSIPYVAVMWWAILFFRFLCWSLHTMFPIPLSSAPPMFEWSLQVCCCFFFWLGVTLPTSFHMFGKSLVPKCVAAKCPFLSTARFRCRWSRRWPTTRGRALLLSWVPQAVWQLAGVPGTHPASHRATLPWMVSAE